MAESLAALGVAANVVQFVDLGCRVTKTVIEVYNSADGLTAQNVDLQAAATELETLSVRLRRDTKQQAADPGLGHLLERSIAAAKDLSKEIQNLRFNPGPFLISERLARFITAMRTIRRKRKVQDLQLRLVELRHQLFLRLQVLLLNRGSGLADSVNTLHGAASEAKDEIHAQAKQIEAMRVDVKRILSAQASWSSNHHLLQDFTQRFLAFVDRFYNQKTISTILKSLHFEQIVQRQNEIPEAHQNTFKWMFDAEGGEGFRRWLRGPSGGVFWITGKPGSGKSTLMKFLLQHPRTAELLKEWSTDDRPLLRVSHFFWGVGGRLQGSEEGLLRTLLFQVLTEYPELVPKVCPDRYSTPYRCLESWTTEELSKSYQRLTKLERLPGRIFLLVDGLDEYSGESAAIARAVKDMAACPDIKICCSSREWRAFEVAFKSAKGIIRMHHLTENDIRNYVHDCLGMDEHYMGLRARNPSEARELVDALTSRAEGVFFWVSLAVKSLLRGLGSDDSIGILRRRLEDLPKDLDEFFKKMLQSIEPVYKEQTSLVLNCLLLANSSLPVTVFAAMEQLSPLFERLKTTGFFDGPPPLTEDCASDDPRAVAKHHRYRKIPPTFGGSPKLPSWKRYYRTLWEAEIQPGATSPLTVADESIDSQPRKIAEYGRDLIQCWPQTSVDSEEDTDLVLHRVGFIHRTVVDFLRAGDAQSLLMTSISPSQGYFHFALARSFLHLLENDDQGGAARECVRWALRLAALDESRRTALLLSKLDRDLVWNSGNIESPTHRPRLSDGYSEEMKAARLTSLVPGYLSILVSHLGLQKPYLETVRVDLLDHPMSQIFWRLCFLQVLQPAMDLALPDDGERQGRHRGIDLDALRYLFTWAEHKSSTVWHIFDIEPIRYMLTDPQLEETALTLATHPVLPPSTEVIRDLNFIYSSIGRPRTSWNLEGAKAVSVWGCFLHSFGGVVSDNSFAACKILARALAKSFPNFGHNPRRFSTLMGLPHPNYRELQLETFKRAASYFHDLFGRERAEELWVDALRGADGELESEVRTQFRAAIDGGNVDWET